MTPKKLIKAIRLSFIGSEQVYREGSCYGLFRILKTVFPEAVPYWNEEARHCITKIGSRFYDIGGEVKKPVGYKEETEAYARVSIVVALPEKGQERYERFSHLMPLDTWAKQSI